MIPETKIAELEAAISARDEDIKNLREKIRHLEMRLFGAKSEKRSAYLGDQQAELFVLEEDEEAEPEQDREPRRVVGVRRRSSTGRKPLPDHLPRIEKQVDLEPEEKRCCGQEMACIGTDVGEVLESLPAVYYVIRYLIPKYTCPICNGDQGCHGSIATADLPARILPGSSAGNSVVAEVVVNKMADGLPGYRQAKRFERVGLTIAHRTLTNWLLRVAKKCHIMDKLLLQSVFSSGAVQMDETFFQVMGEEGRNNRTKSYMWVMRSVLADCPVVYFVYHPTRASAVPRALLANYSGFIQTDGYKGYDFLDTLEQVSLVACWAHVRRKFHEVLKTTGKKKKKAKNKPYAEQVLSLIGQLYGIEKKAKNQALNADELAAWRAQEAKPILTALKASLEDQVARFPQQSLTGKAIGYTLRLWPRLVRYADNGIMPIDNNGIENVIRPFVVGRKNWLFAGSPEGAAAMATLFSLIETAKANHWEPYAYLRFLFDHLPNAVGEQELGKLLPHIAQPVPTSFYLDHDRQQFQNHAALEPPTG